MKSPCVGVCRFDGRTLAECREWRKAPRPRLLAIDRALPGRLHKLAERGVRVFEEGA